MDISETINTIIAGLNRVGQLMRSQSATAIAMVSFIEPTTVEQEHEPISLISPQLHTGQQALELAAQAYSDLTYMQMYSKKAVRRTIGVVTLPNNNISKEIAVLIRETNTLKKQLQEHITQEYTGRKARYNALHYSYDGIFTNHLYRSINLIHNLEAKKVTFTWKRKEIVARIDKKALLDELKEIIGNSNQTSKQITLSSFHNAIEELPTELIRCKRVVKVIPWARITTTTNAINVVASLPIIIINDEKVSVKPIKTFDASIKNKVRRDSQSSALIGHYKGSSYVKLAKQSGHDTAVSIQPTDDEIQSNSLYS